MSYFFCGCYTIQKHTEPLLYQLWFSICSINIIRYTLQIKLLSIHNHTIPEMSLRRTTNRVVTLVLRVSGHSLPPSTGPLILLEDQDNYYYHHQQISGVDREFT